MDKVKLTAWETAPYGRFRLETAVGTVYIRFAQPFGMCPPAFDERTEGLKAARFHAYWMLNAFHHGLQEGKRLARRKKV